MASLDSFSIAILLGSVLVMAGILSSLLALRFGAPLLLVFLAIGMLAGDAGPGQLQFSDVGTTYLVGSVALALILFDGGLKTRFASIRTVLAPSLVLATMGVLVTALVTAPFTRYALDLNWSESLLVGAVVASTDAAAVFLLVHTQGLRLRPRVGATLEAESGTNDPFASFLTLMLVEYISLGSSSAEHVVMEFVQEAVLGTVVGVIGGRLVVLALDTVALPQGLPAIAVALVLMLVARPLAVFLCLAPFRFNWREKVVIAWTGLRGAVAIFLASIPMLVGLSKTYHKNNDTNNVVIISLLLQGWT